jgi:predicted MFS family arabinose efflux permease
LIEATARSQTRERPLLSRRLTLLLAAACGVGVANVYFPQAITPLLATDLHVSRGAAAFVATTSQLGYVLGIFFLVPLGDRLPRRPLIVSLFAVVAIGLFLSGAAPSLALLLVLSALVGAATVVPQILIPMGADLADGASAARVVGALQGGLLGGILLARTFGGTLGQWLGWRAPYLIAGGLAMLLSALLAVALPATPGSSSHRYPALLATSLRLFRELPDLRRSCFYQAALFAGFTAAWTSLALFLTGSTYHYGTSVVGLVALVGAVSVVGVPLTGRLIDRRGPDGVSRVSFIGVGLAAAVLLAGSLGGRAGFVGLLAGMLLLDVSVQASQVANQARIFALVPDARSRLNSSYMTCVFLGGSAGSWIGTRAYLAFGWNGVCAVVAVAGALALGRDVFRPSA